MAQESRLGAPQAGKGVATAGAGDGEAGQEQSQLCGFVPRAGWERGVCSGCVRGAIEPRTGGEEAGTVLPVGVVVVVGQVEVAAQVGAESGDAAGGQGRQMADVVARGWAPTALGGRAEQVDGPGRIGDLLQVASQARFLQLDSELPDVAGVRGDGDQDKVAGGLFAQVGEAIQAFRGEKVGPQDDDPVRAADSDPGSGSLSVPNRGTVTARASGGWRSRGEEHALAQEVQACPAEHLPLQHLDLE
ncbi:hypothetical protein ACFU6K_00685 [Kitasatospora sp. NPDC057512]|uniref:hypothetical protein n=1 Tax=Kitasatospora sp. NPDC057512 TaxID=3346154 RepID=UPI00367D908D